MRMCFGEPLQDIIQRLETCIVFLMPDAIEKFWDDDGGNMVSVLSHDYILEREEGCPIKKKVLNIVAYPVERDDAGSRATCNVFQIMSDVLMMDAVIVVVMRSIQPLMEMIVNIMEKPVHLLDAPLQDRILTMVFKGF